MPSRPSSHAASSRRAIRSNQPPKSAEARFGRSRSAIRSSAAIARAAKEIWPEQTAPELAHAAGLSVRGAELLLAGTTAAGTETVLALVHHLVHGRRFLFALMSAADPEPPYWRDLRKQFELSEARAQLRALNKRIGRLEEGDEG